MVIRFGLIGCGAIGKRHAGHITNLEGSQLVAVCDIKEERAKAYAEEFKCDFHTNYQELLNRKDIDVVSVCVPNGLHPEITIAAANAKKNVLCEKPMAITLEQADAMIRAADINQVKLFVVKQNRFNPPVQAVKKSLSKGAFGRIYLINASLLWNRRPGYYDEEPWRGTKELDGGALFTQFSHFIDLMQWLIGPIKSVFAKVGNYDHEKIEIEDTGAIVLKFENGAIGTVNYTTCTYNKNYEGSITILGTKGTVKIGGQYVNVIEHWNVEGYPLEPMENTNPPNEYGSYTGSSSHHDKVIQNVINALNKNEEIVTDGRDGRKSVEIIEAIFKSAKHGQEIFLPLINHEN